MRVTAAVHRFINYVKQYEKCDPAAGETTLNCEPDNRYKISIERSQKSDQILTLFGHRRSSRMETKKHVAATIIIEAPEVKLKV